MEIRKLFHKIYLGIEGFITPTLKYSQYLYEDILKSYVNPDMKWLDLGCGHQILPSWRSREEKYLANNCKKLVGIDYDLSSLRNHRNMPIRIRGDIGKLPLKDKSFDFVSANMVVEHLDRPDGQFKEIGRVLKPGGHFVFHTPNIVGYTAIMGRLVPRLFKDKLIFLFERREEKDVFNTYYKANSRRAIYELAKTSGFEVVKIKMIVSLPQFVIIPPLVLLELIWIRVLMTKRLNSLRTNIIAVLRKQK